MWKNKTLLNKKLKELAQMEKLNNYLDWVRANEEIMLEHEAKPTQIWREHISEATKITFEEQIQAEVENIKPGIFKYTTDTGASLNTVANQLASLIQKTSIALPEYGGKLGERSKATIESRRLLMDDSITLLAEVLKVRDNFYNSYEDQTKTKTQVFDKQDNINYLNKLRGG